MAMCNDCGIMLMLGDNWSDNNHKNCQYVCNDCKNECVYTFNKTHRKQRLVNVKKYNDKRLKLFQRIMHDLKINGCAICGYDKCNDALSFHHTCDNDKAFCLKQSNLEYSNARIIDEINKCILLCANCHREIHYRERKQMEK